MHHRIIITAALLSLAADTAYPQTLPKLPGAASSMLGGGLPDLSSMGIPNVAGVLGYCVKNKLLSGSGAGSVVDGLTGKPGVTSSPDYAAGAAGNIITGKGGSPLSMASMPAQLKTQACDMVLQQGTKLL